MNRAIDSAGEQERQAALYGRSDSRMEQLRMPPQSAEAEQAVLGGLLMHADPDRARRAWSEISDLLTEHSFYRRDHQLIWRAIKHLEGKSKPFDAVTVGEFLESQGLGEQIAGGAYLVELASTTPSAANIRAYAEIVADKALRRRLIERGTEIVNDGFGNEDTLEIVGRAQTGLGELLAEQPCELESITPVMLRVFDKLQDRHSRGGGIDGMPTGYTDLDVIINGFKPGGLYLLAARPKMGKTTLAQNLAEHVALEEGKPVAVFSFEMQPDELGDRMLSSIGGIDGDRIRRGELDDVDWSNVTAAIRKLRGAQIYVSRPRSARVDHVVAQTRRQHARKPLGLAVIDYLQLMQTNGDNRAQGIGDITRALKLMAGELGIPVLLLSQLNRDLEKRLGDKRPIPADLRDSGAIEQDADAVIFIYRDEYYDRNSRDRGTAEIIVALQRNGPSGMARLQYRPERFRFDNLPEGWEPAPLPVKEQGAKKGFKKIGDKAPAPRADIDA